MCSRSRQKCCCIPATIHSTLQGCNFCKHKSVFRRRKPFAWRMFILVYEKATVTRSSLQLTHRIGVKPSSHRSHATELNWTAFSCVASTLPRLIKPSAKKRNRGVGLKTPVRGWFFSYKRDNTTYMFTEKLDSWIWHYWHLRYSTQ